MPCLPRYNPAPAFGSLSYCIATQNVKQQIDMQMSVIASPAPECTSQNQWDSEPRHKDKLKSMGFDMENSLESICPVPVSSYPPIPSKRENQQAD